MQFKKFNQFVNENSFMSVPADSAKIVKKFNDVQTGYNKDAVSAEPGGFGNGGNAGAPAVGEDGPTMLSKRLGDIEPVLDDNGNPEKVPSSAGQVDKITQPGTTIVSHDNMRGEPMLTKTN